MGGLKVAVTGSAGGLGVSTIAVAVAARLAHAHGGAVCIDTDVGGGGLDVVAGLEATPGVRWEDLGAVEGAVDGPALRSALPSSGGLTVLSYAGLRREGSVPWSDGSPGPALVEVVDALSAVGCVVVDVSRSLGRGAELAASGCCDVTVLVHGAGVRSLAAAADLAEALAALDSANAPAVVGCPRGRRRGLPDHVLADLADVVGVPVSVLVPEDRRVVDDAARGLVPGLSRGRFAGAVDRLMAAVESAATPRGVAPVGSADEAEFPWAEVVVPALPGAGRGAVRGAVRGMGRGSTRRAGAGARRRGRAA